MKMIPIILLWKRPKTAAMALMITGVALAFLFSACGSGGGSDDNSPSIVKDTVTLTGKVAVSASSSAIQGAQCRFVDRQGNEIGTATADETGQYTLEVPVDVEGEIRCTPTGFSSLALTTYGSTTGLSAGDFIEGEDVTLFSTVAAQIIASEESADPVARKTEVLTALVDGQDPDLNLVAELAEKLYDAMLYNQMDIDFTQDPSRQADGDGGGIGGMVTNGISYESPVPIAGARCAFMVDGPLSDGRSVLYDVALADFYGDGRLSRPDLQGVRQQINDNYDGRAQEIVDAFARVFPNGIGQAYTATTDENGAYFIAVPSGLPGYVCCTPQGQDNLVLATYVPGRAEGQSLYGQDVSPATTVYCVQIANRFNLTDTVIQATKDNYLEDIKWLRIQMLQDNNAVTGFELWPGSEPDNKAAELSAFCGTALFNTLYHSQLDVDFPSVLENLFQEQELDPENLTAQGVGADAAQACSDVVNTAVTQAESSLDTQLDLALSTARIDVMVLDTPEGPPVPDLHVMIVADPGHDALDCSGCNTPTDAHGRVSLVLTGLSSDIATIDLTTADTEQHARETIQLVPLATQDVTIILNPNVQPPFTLQMNASGNEYMGTGRVTSQTGDINCSYISGRIEGDLDSFSDPEDCYAFLQPSTSVTLTAAPAWWCTFAGWQGDVCSGTEPTCQLTMDRHQTVVALFSPLCEESLYDVWPAYRNISASGDSNSDRIFIDDNFLNSCGEFSATITAEWMTSEISDEPGEDFYINASENPEDGPRTGTILYGGHVVTIAQDGQQCAVVDYGVSPGATTFDAAGGTGTIAVRAPANCPWQAAADSDWITVTSDTTSSSGDGTVTYSVAANPGASRGSYITIAGTHHLVVQEDAASNPPPALTIHGEGEGAGWIVAQQYVTTNAQTNQWDIRDHYICTLNSSFSSGHCGMVYKPETIVQLDATRGHHSNWIFSNWTGSCGGTYHQCRVTMDQMHTVGARFIVSGQPDLAISELMINRQYLSVGGAIDIMNDFYYERQCDDDNFLCLMVNFENRGTEDAQNFSVGLYLSSDANITTDDILLEEAQRTVNQLSSKEDTYLYSHARTRIPANTPLGPAYLGVIVDEFNSVDEDIETNNVYSIPVHIVSED